jgi:uncharacterized membrane protein
MIAPLPNLSRAAEVQPSAAEIKRREYVNIGATQRLLCAVGGGALALYGLTRRSLGGLALAALGGALVQRGVTGHSALFASLGLNTSNAPHGRLASVRAGVGVKVETVFTVNRPARELFRAWRNLENLPIFMRHLASVRADGTRSHWVAKGPAGYRAEWDAEIINERENELIAWRSLEGGDVDTAGSVHFTTAPALRGTEVRVVLKYNPPAGKTGASIARLFGQAPEQYIEEDLLRFKHWMEAREPATVAGQPSP